MRYTTLSMPLAEMKALLVLVQTGHATIIANHPPPACPITPAEHRAIRRLRLAVEGKDLRATNRHNTHTPKRARTSQQAGATQ